MCPVFFLIKFNIILYIWLFILKYKSVVASFGFVFAFAKFFGAGGGGGGGWVAGCFLHPYASWN